MAGPLTLVLAFADKSRRLVRKRVNGNSGRLPFAYR
jgi:hypothetical protein